MFTSPEPRVSHLLVAFASGPPSPFFPRRFSSLCAGYALAYGDFLCLIYLFFAFNVNVNILLRKSEDYTELFIFRWTLHFFIINHGSCAYGARANERASAHNILDEAFSFSVSSSLLLCANWYYIRTGRFQWAFAKYSSHWPPKSLIHLHTQKLSLFLGKTKACSMLYILRRKQHTISWLFSLTHTLPRELSLLIFKFWKS